MGITLFDVCRSLEFRGIIVQNKRRQNKIIANLMQQSYFRSSPSQEIPSSFPFEFEGSLLCSQEPDAGPYLWQMNAVHILKPYLYPSIHALVSQVVAFIQYSYQNALCFVISHTCGTSPTLLILLDSFTSGSWSPTGDQSSPSRIGVKNAWHFTCMPLWSFMS
jgi:hypothetical protein